MLKIIGVTPIISSMAKIPKPEAAPPAPVEQTEAPATPSNEQVAAIIDAAIAGTAWIDPTDAQHELTTRVVIVDGQAQFRSEKTDASGEQLLVTADEIAAEITNRKPHWIKKPAPPAGTAATGSTQTRVVAIDTYKDVMKDEKKLRDFIANKPEKLAALRAAHFATLAILALAIIANWVYPDFSHAHYVGAMAFSVISNFTFEPQVAAEYASEKLVENLELISRATGIIETHTVDEFQSSQNAGSEFIDLPYFAAIGSLLTRRDLTATTAPTDLDITGAEQKAVICRRKLGPVKFTEDVFVRGLRRESVEKEIGNQMGIEAAKEIRSSLIACAMGALAGWTSTPHTVTSIYNVAVHDSTTIMTFARLLALKMKLGDAANALTHYIVHSDVFADIIGDGLSTYKMDSVGGYNIATGLARAFGMNFIVTDDAQLKVTNGGNYKKYYTLAIGPKAFKLVYAQKLRIEAERRLDFEAPYWRVLGQLDFAPHPNGHKYTSTANPTLANLGDSSKWDQALNDHRECLIAIQEHNAAAA